MNIGYLDCFSGMSSSRFIGALVSAGVPEHVLHDAVDALDIGARLQLVQVTRNSVRTIRANVTFVSTPEEKNCQYDLSTFVQADFVSGKKQQLSTIQALISNAALPHKAQELAITTFTSLAIAQAQISGMPVEEICFHELKGLHTVVGVVVCCVGCVWLGVDRWYASALNVGSGVLKYPQGSLPIPTPTTLALLGGDAPIFAIGPQKELLTSTCAALLKALNVDFSPCPPMHIVRVGYGGGRIEYDSLPNFLRLCVGNNQTEKKHSVAAETIVIEAEIGTVSELEMQDMQQKLYEKGGQLVYATPITCGMNAYTKKLTILSLPEEAAAIRLFLFGLGFVKHIHWRIENYDSLIYYDEQILTPWGKIKVQIGQLLGSQVVSVTPDGNICQEISQKHGLPHAQVVETAKALFFSRKN